MKKILVCLVISLLVSSLAVIGFAAEKVTKVRFGSNTMGTVDYIVMSAMSQIIERNSDLRVFVEPTTGTSAQALLLAKGQVDVAIGASGHPYVLRRGGEGYENAYPEYVKAGKTPLRLLMSGNQLPFGILASKASGIQSVKELKGKRLFGISTGSVGMEMAARGYLEAVGLEWNKDVKILTMTGSAEGCDRVAMREAEAVVTTSGGSKIREFEVSVGGWFLNAPIDPKAMAIYRKYYPGVVPWTAEKDEPCLKKGTTMFAMPRYLYTTSALDKDVAYKIVKALDLNREELAKITRELKEWTRQMALLEICIPVHPGAIKYYKEAGMWPPELDELQKKLLAEGP